MDDDDVLGEPRCEACGTVMHVIDGGYRCRGCGWELDVPWLSVDPPPEFNGPAIRGG